jgi:hypothetical protein
MPRRRAFRDLHDLKDEVAARRVTWQREKFRSWTMCRYSALLVERVLGSQVPASAEVATRLKKLEPQTFPKSQLVAVRRPRPPQQARRCRDRAEGKRRNRVLPIPMQLRCQSTPADFGNDCRRNREVEHGHSGQPISKLIRRIANGS